MPEGCHVKKDGEGVFRKNWGVPRKNPIWGGRGVSIFSTVAKTFLFFFVFGKKHKQKEDDLIGLRQSLRERNSSFLTIN